MSIFIFVKRLLLSYVLLMAHSGWVLSQPNIPIPPRDFSFNSSFAKNGDNASPSLALLPANSYFTQNIQVNSDPTNQGDDTSPTLATYKDTLYSVWSGDPTTDAILFARSIDGGLTWTTPIRINDTVTYPPSYYAYQPDIAVNNQGHIFIIWFDYRFWSSDSDFNSPIETFMDLSMDSGETWRTDIQVTTGSGLYPWHYQGYLAINPTNNNIHVAFTDLDRYDGVDLGDISIVNSYDGGLTFSPKIRVDNLELTSKVSQSFSDIAVDPRSQNVYVVFEDTRNSDKDIFMAISTDSGVSIDTNIQVNTVVAGNQDEPAIALDTGSNKIYVAWKDNREDMTPDTTPYLNHIYIAKSASDHLSFHPGVQVTDVYMSAETGFNFPPDIATGKNGEVYVVWHDYRKGYTNVFYDQTLDAGISFGEDIQINTNEDSLTHALPRIEIDHHGKSFIVWFDDRNELADNGNGDIFIGGSALESCSANVYLSGHLTSGDYGSGISLQSNGTILSGAIVDLSAGYWIELSPDFVVNQGSELTIQITGCNP